MSLNESLLSSAKTDDESSDLWETPIALVLAAEALLDVTFDLDPCCFKHNAVPHRLGRRRATALYTPDFNGLKVPWHKYGKAAFVNPPYSAAAKWVAKAAREGVHMVTVCLIPARTDTSYWHDHAFGGANPCAQIVFLRGRVKFEGADHGAPFPSALLVWRPQKTQCRVTAWDYQDAVKSVLR